VLTYRREKSEVRWALPEKAIAFSSRDANAAEAFLMELDSDNFFKLPIPNYFIVS
jgi:hypothetical protein